MIDEPWLIDPWLLIFDPNCVTIFLFKDAWGALSEYLKLYDKFPQPFMEWFDSIFQIYQIRDEFGERIAPFEAILRLYLLSGRENRDALDAYALITSVSAILKLLKNHIKNKMIMWLIEF